MRRSRPILIAFGLFLATSPAFAGFASQEQYLPAVGRVSGQNGAEFYTTIWATNLTSVPVSFTFEFLKAGQANTSPASFADNLAPGETKVYENIVGSRLGLSNALGGARVTSSGEILVAERIYNQPPGADLGETEGLFFAGVPKSFSISMGQSASIQGIDQGGTEDFRYNFALLETGGGSPTVNIQLFDGSGTMLGQKAYDLQPYEQLQPNVKDLFSGVATTNARITATVTGGTGSAIIAGAQLANTSQDSSGFEMSFRGELLGGSAPAGVMSLNGLTGALTIAHGANTTVNVSGSTITIDAVSGSGTGLTAVAHDNSLIGSGTVAVPLGLANGQVVRSLTVGASTLHDAITLASGNGISITPSGSTLTIAATGGGGGGVTSLDSLTGAVSLTAGNGISVTPSGSSISIAYTGGGSSGLASVTHDATLTGAGTGASSLGIAAGGVNTTQLAASAVQGANIGNGQVVRSVTAGSTTIHDAVTLAAGSNVTLTPSGSTITIAASGGGGSGLTLPYFNAFSSGTGFGINNTANSGVSIWGSATPGDADGVYGTSAGTGIGVKGISGGGIGVYGSSSATYGVEGITTGGNAGFAGVFGKTTGSWAGVEGDNAAGNKGYLGGPDYGVFGNGGTSAAVYGLNTAHPGVYGKSSTSYGVRGDSANGIPGVYGTTSGSGPSVEGLHSSGNVGYLGGPDYAVYGVSASNYAVYGSSTGSGVGGVYGESTGSNSIGVYGISATFVGMYAKGQYGIFAYTTAPGGVAGDFHGNVDINGNVHTSGAGAVTFDDPADPANETITHSFVGSSEMKNLYDGVATLGPTGVAIVELPSWFETLNKDFRYQLTALGTPQAGLFVSREISDNRFTIAGGVPGARVSWLVTGVRRDPWANAHPIAVRERKPDSDRGFYIAPELYGQPKTKSADSIAREQALKEESARVSRER